MKIIYALCQKPIYFATIRTIDFVENSLDVCDRLKAIEFSLTFSVTIYVLPRDTMIKKRKNCLLVKIEKSLISKIIMSIARNALVLLWFMFIVFSGITFLPKILHRSLILNVVFGLVSA